MTSPEGWIITETEQNDDYDVVTIDYGEPVVESEIIEDDTIILSDEKIDINGYIAQKIREYFVERGVDISMEESQKLAPYGDSFSRLQQISNETSYTIPALLKDKWLLGENAPNDFPFDAPETVKAAYLLQHSPIKLGIDWKKGSIGKIIHARLKAGIESTIHDASFWLKTFEIPEKINKAKGPGQLEEVTLYDTNVEFSLMARIFHDKDIRTLPKKRQKIDALLYNPFSRYIYTILIERLQAGEPIDYKDMKMAIKERAVSYVSEHGYRDGEESAKNFQSVADGMIEGLIGPRKLFRFDFFDRDLSRQKCIEMLSQYSANRQEYVRDTTVWLARHATVPNARLTRVWGDRQLALSEGVEDTAGVLERWQKKNAMRIYMDKFTDEEWQENFSLSKDEIKEKYADAAKDLFRHYSIAETVSAICDFSEFGSGIANVPVAVIDLDKDGDRYTGEILRKDDHRGMTIGPDTGCCMMISGIAESCLWDGYENPNAGFFALYNAKGKIMAQSFFYVNPECPDTLVLDNIEANKGRDIKKIVELYRQYWEQYLAERLANDSGWQIRKVHVGTGYGEAVQAYIKELPYVPVILHPKIVSWLDETMGVNFDVGDLDLTQASIYTDAHEDQRLLLEMASQRVNSNKLWSRVIEKQVHLERAISTEMIPISEALYHVVANLERETYPAYILHEGRNGDMGHLRDELKMPMADDFSFVLKAKTEQGRDDYRAYCIAYMTDSEVDLSYNGSTVYVSDFVVAPDIQGKKYGLEMFRELFTRIVDAGITNIEMQVRETTSYAALMQSKSIKDLLESHGYVLLEPKELIEYRYLETGDIERMHFLAVRKSQRDDN